MGRCEEGEVVVRKLLIALMLLTFSGCTFRCTPNEWSYMKGCKETCAPKPVQFASGTHDVCICDLR